MIYVMLMSDFLLSSCSSCAGLCAYDLGLTRTTHSISTATPSGSALVPMADRACAPPTCKAAVAPPDHEIFLKKSQGPCLNQRAADSLY